MEPEPKHSGLSLIVFAIRYPVHVEEPVRAIRLDHHDPLQAAAQEGMSDLDSESFQLSGQAQDVYHTQRVVVIIVDNIRITTIDLSKPFIYRVFSMSETVHVTCHS